MRNKVAAWENIRELFILSEVYGRFFKKEVSLKIVFPLKNVFI